MSIVFYHGGRLEEAEKLQRKKRFFFMRLPRFARNGHNTQKVELVKYIFLFKLTT